MLKKVLCMIVMPLMVLGAWGNTSGKCYGSTIGSEAFVMLSDENFPVLEKIAQEFYQKVVFGTYYKAPPDGAILY